MRRLSWSRLLAFFVSRDGSIFLLVKLALCFLIAVAVHELVLIPSSTNIYSSEMSRINTAINGANDSAKIPADQKSSGTEYPDLKKEEYKISLEVFDVNNPPKLKPECKRENPLATDEVGKGYLVLVVKKDAICPRFVSFAFKNEFLLPIISNPKLRDSIHSMSRVVEMMAFAKPDGKGGFAPSTTDLKLCAGTRKLLDDKECSEITRILNPVFDALAAPISRMRIASLMLGTIQAASLGLFFFIVLECLIIWLRWIAPRAVFFTRNRDPESSAQKFVMKSGEDLDAAINEFSKSKSPSIGDRLLTRTIISLRTSETSGEVTSDTGVMNNSLEAYREYLSDEAGNTQEPLDTANEILLKLAFVGTIWGIGDALFLSRNLETMDPIEKVITKSDMFSGIGTAFGTTLIGVILSIFASAVVQSLNSKWNGKINMFYKAILSLGFSNVSSGANAVSMEQLRQLREDTMPNVLDGGSTTGLGILGKLGGVIVVGLLLFWVIKSGIGNALFDSLATVWDKI